MIHNKNPDQSLYSRSLSAYRISGYCIIKRQPVRALVWLRECAVWFWAFHVSMIFEITERPQVLCFPALTGTFRLSVVLCASDKFLVRTMRKVTPPKKQIVSQRICQGSNLHHALSDQCREVTALGRGRLWVRTHIKILGFFSEDYFPTMVWGQKAQFEF